MLNFAVTFQLDFCSEYKYKDKQNIGDISLTSTKEGFQKKERKKRAIYNHLHCHQILCSI